MDLGFGAANQSLGQATATALARSAQAQEARVEAELERYDSLLFALGNNNTNNNNTNNNNDGDDDELQRLRQKRLLEHQRAVTQLSHFRSLPGHGVYQELTHTSASSSSSNVARAFFAAAAASERLVVHFHRPTTRRCDAFHAHLSRLAADRVETRFVSVNVQECEGDDSNSTTTNSGVAFLVERLRISVMPTLLLVLNRQTIHQIRGFDELGGSDSFSTRKLTNLLVRHGMLLRRHDDNECDDDEDEED